jgi:hypothetical protein
MLLGAANAICPDCKHALAGNMHGFDQNDGYLDTNGKLAHSGRCTYCRICNPQIFGRLKPHAA